jgi:hypothetical protein
MLFEAILAATMVCVPPPPAAESAAPPPALSNVRPRDGIAAQLLSLGREQSPTFRGLERVLNESQVVVYIDVRESPNRDLGGALHFVGASRARRFVRAVIDTGTLQFARTQERLVLLASVLGHELQHAVEVATATSIDDERAFEALFRRIGISSEREALETLEAQRIATRVKRELEERRRNPDPCGIAARFARTGGHM